MKIEIVGVGERIGILCTDRESMNMIKLSLENAASLAISLADAVDKLAGMRETKSDNQEMS